ncbi:conjugative transposon protein TraM [Chitinophaga sp. RCC_12]|uniref:conjugative transposon protein TraM n=1 Tax=Chitinophaga sp. RCC_12 TaxID=3239226 RepID=UPI0035245AEC
MEHTEQFNKRRKFLLMLPLMALPFATLAFWAAGGGKTGQSETKKELGVNSNLPGAHLAVQPKDKMGIYQKAAKDSAGMRSQLSFEPFIDRDSFAVPAPDSLSPTMQPYTGGLIKQWSTAPDPNEAKVRNGLQRLEEAINRPLPETREEPDLPVDNTTEENIKRLEEMMQSVTATSGPDKEMQQINGMLENILDIQNPGRAEQKLKEQSLKNRGRVYAVSKPQLKTTADYLPNGQPPYGTKVIDSGLVPIYEPSTERNAFYGLSVTENDYTQQTAIPAAIHGTQTLVSGSTVKMRILEDILINGVTIPEGSFIYGTCTVSGERLKIEIPGIRYSNNIFPVSLTVFALDALEGIPIPGALTRDAAKEGADRTLQSMQLMSLDPSIGAQAAGAGVEVAKGLFGKKAKLVRVTVKADYPLMLMDEKTRQESH